MYLIGRIKAYLNQISYNTLSYKIILHIVGQV